MTIGDVEKIVIDNVENIDEKTCGRMMRIVTGNGDFLVIMTGPGVETENKNE